MRCSCALDSLAFLFVLGCGEADGPVHPPAADLLAEGKLVSTIAFTSTRHDPTATTPPAIFLATEIYLMRDDGTNVYRLTFNAAGDAFAALSPQGDRIVFDSNRLRDPLTEPLNTSDLFVMNPDGSAQTWLLRGSSASWHRDGAVIAYHASASGTGLPIRPDPGSATTDSDLFVLNVNDCLATRAQDPAFDCRPLATNLTNTPEFIEDDVDWSPDGKKVVFTRHGVNDPHLNAATAEIYHLNLKTGQLKRLTDNSEEERGPDWSPDGSRVVYSCRKGTRFDLCTMNMDITAVVQLTSTATEAELTATWSPDAQHVVFHKFFGGANQLFKIRTDGTGAAIQLTNVGHNLLANWGVLRAVD